MDARLPTHIEVSALIRQVGAAGGFGMVLAKGEPDAGTILALLTHNGKDGRIYERMPALDGTRKWQCTRRQNPEKPGDLQEYLDRRKRQDPDVWVIELDIVNAERFIGIEIEQG